MFKPGQLVRLKHKTSRGYSAAADTIATVADPLDEIFSNSKRAYPPEGYIFLIWWTGVQQNGGYPECDFEYVHIVDDMPLTLDEITTFQDILQGG